MKESELIRLNQNKSELVRVNPNKSELEGGVLNRVQLLILSMLYGCEAINRHSAMTVSEIVTTENLGYQDNTFYKYLKKFMIDGFVSTGIKEGRALTFYITQEGIKRLEEERDG